MKRLTFLILFLCVAHIGTTPANTIPDAEQSFLLFYSNDVNGETEPCG